MSCWGRDWPSFPVPAWPGGTDDHCRPSAVLAPIQPVFTDAERVALAGYRGLTCEAYALDLRQFASWCRARSVALFAVRRADIESFARELEAMGRARAAVTRRLSALAGFYRYAVEEELLDRAYPDSRTEPPVTGASLPVNARRRPVQHSDLTRMSRYVVALRVA